MKNQKFGVMPPSALDYGYFVKAAYDVYNALPDVLSPTQDQYPEFPSGYRLLFNIQMSNFFGPILKPVYFGFAAIDLSNPSSIVIAIRGTVGWMEWWDNLHAYPVPCPFAPNSGNVVAGFLDLYNSLKILAPGVSSFDNAIALSETVVPGLKSVFNLDNYTQVTVAGHSLGASLATLYGLHMAATNSKRSVVIYTYASPCTGNQDFVNYYNTVISESYRIYNEPDVVPKILLWLGYSAVPVGFELNSLLDPNVKQSIGCYHYLTTYLYLLGAPASILGPCATT
ncbi:Lipase (class 3) [Mucilaginibacter sp. OK268]|uniref:lipase family protein n=1 Tax=Mucilaginibacter sp. OK268 TaxID=1881048 RepID=UPI00088634E6|nr:lipase family protein [Mucilaginibacter sp. OK268]SDP50488.1 Lipase (class 3) [Mucilaginibacter sp. OK268]